MKNMKKHSILSVFQLLFILVFAVSISITGCKTKKKLTDDKTDKTENTENTNVTDNTSKPEKTYNKEDALSKLNDILNDDSGRANSLRNKEIIDSIAALGIDDPDIEAKLAAVKKKLTSIEHIDNVKSQLNTYFSDIAQAGQAGNYSTANQKISQALKLCVSSDVPVLIKVGQSYGRPTTIEKHLNYVKDQKQFKRRVEDIIVDENGKIKEITLNQK